MSDDINKSDQNQNPNPNFIPNFPYRPDIPNYWCQRFGYIICLNLHTYKETCHMENDPMLTDK